MFTQLTLLKCYSNCFPLLKPEHACLYRLLGKEKTLLEWAVVLLSKKWSVWSGVGDGWISDIRLLWLLVVLIKASFHSPMTNLNPYGGQRCKDEYS